VTSITEVRLNTTEGGIDLILEASGALESSEPSVAGNAWVTDMPNARLDLPDGDEFSAANPIEGIALITATNLPNNRVRIAITGLDALPTVEIRAEASGLAWSVAPGTSMESAEDDSIQIVVTGEEDEYAAPDATTATRTDTPILDIPQSIQVIPQQVLEVTFT
jgi:iron complex outermembrane recepter protein